MKKIKDVWFNRGRWLFRCPICGSKNEIRPTKTQKQIKVYCGSQYCYPDKLKRIPRVMPDGAIRFGLSAALQRAAAESANQNGEIFIVVMPENWVNAESLLKVRRTVHQGFYPGVDFKPPNNKGETVADLERENASDPVLEYLQVEPEPELKKSKPKKTDRKPLSDAEFRRLQ